MSLTKILLMMGLFSGVGCSRPTAENPSAPSSSSSAPDACGFLSKEEIAAVQGAPPVSVQGSRRTQAGVLVQQCAISLPTAADSINLSVFQKVSDVSPRLKMWDPLFHSEPKKKVDREGKVKEPIKPVPVEGVGDEAFWYGGQFGGMLHARKGENFIQMSVGGPGDPEQKKGQMRVLAEKVLNRL